MQGQGLGFGISSLRTGTGLTYALLSHLVELKENECAKAATLREQYWRYLVYDCGAGYRCAFFGFRVPLLRSYCEPKAGRPSMTQVSFRHQRKQPKVYCRQA